MRSVPMRLRLLAAAAVAVVVLAGAAIAWWQVGAAARTSDRPLAPGIIAGAPQIGGPFTLIDHNGQEVTDATFRGKYLFPSFFPDAAAFS